MNITNCPICFGTNITAGTDTYKHRYYHDKEVVHICMACSDCGSQISLRQYNGKVSNLQSIAQHLWDSYGYLEV